MYSTLYPVPQIETDKYCRLYPSAHCTTFFILNHSSFLPTVTLITSLQHLIHNNYDCGHCFKPVSIFLLQLKDRIHCDDILVHLFLIFGSLLDLFSLSLSILPCYELTSRKSTCVSSVFVCPENSSVHRVSTPDRPR